MQANTSTGTNIMTPWRGIKNVWNFGKLSDSDFNLLYVTKEQKLADETNVLYSMFDDTELPTFRPDPEPPPRPTAEQMPTVKEVWEHCEPVMHQRHLDQMTSQLRF